MCHLFYFTPFSTLSSSFSAAKRIFTFPPLSPRDSIIYWQADMELLGTSLKNILMSNPQLKRIICQIYFFDTKDIFPNNFSSILCVCGDKEDEKIAMSIHASQMSCSNWTLQNHRITAWLRQWATSTDHLVPLLFRVGSSRAGCSGPCPRMETPQLLWATCAGVKPQFQQKKGFSYI